MPHALPRLAPENKPQTPADRDTIEWQSALQSLRAQVRALQAERAELQRALQSAEHFADRDPLCPVFNRRAFERELQREIASAERHGNALCLAFLDLDNFKQINDHFGHAAGDKVLCHVTQLLTTHMRQTDIIGRLGGDEFGIVLTHADLTHAQTRIAALTAQIDELIVRDRLQPQGKVLHLGASFGLAAWNKGMQVSDLIRVADEAMFSLKTQRKSAPKSA